MDVAVGDGSLPSDVVGLAGPRIPGSSPWGAWGVCVGVSVGVSVGVGVEVGVGLSDVGVSGLGGVAGVGGAG